MPPNQTETRFAVLLFTDLVGSTELKTRHGVPAYSEALGIHNKHFERAAQACHGIRILQNVGDGYFAEANSVAEAVRFALLFQSAMREESWGGISLSTRIGIHAGEISTVATQGGSGIVAPAADLAARVMSLALGGQILLTRFPFDEARHFIREHPAIPGKVTPPLRWLAHGPYLLKGRDEPMEIFEVGAEGLAPLIAPPDSEKAKRAVRPGEEETLGWRPAIGLEVPGRPGWKLVAKLGSGGFGEVWKGEHEKFGQSRAFKFCFDDERLRALKREVTLVRLLHTTLGDRDDIVHLHELKLDEPPFYLESDLAPHGSLLQWAEKQGGLAAIPLEQRIELVAHTANALAAAHSIGVLHKDIKPTNILIFDRPDGSVRPCLVDFGIGSLEDLTLLGKHGITAAGFTTAAIKHSTGTPTYSPPEYLAGKPFTIQGDIYGLGVLLYQLVTARPLDPLAVGWERDITDPLLCEDIALCVDGDPTRRLQNAKELADRLFKLGERRVEIAEQKRLAREAASLAETVAAAAQARVRRKKSLWMLAGVFILACLSAVAGWRGVEFFASRSPANVSIISEPSGAAVWRDGVLLGVTPFSEKRKAPGGIDYILKAEGFEDLKCIGILSPGQSLNMDVALLPVVRGTTPVPSVDPAENIYYGKLTESQGVVEFKQADGRWFTVPPGMQLRQGDIVRTRASSRAALTFRDGSILRLSELTEITLTGPNDKPQVKVNAGFINVFQRAKSNKIEIKTLHQSSAIDG